MKPVYNIHKKEQWESQPSDGKMVDCSNKTACAAICRTFYKQDQPSLMDSEHSQAGHINALNK